MRKGKVLNWKYELVLTALLAGNTPSLTIKSLAAETDDIVLLDARDRAEFEVSHLKDAIWVGYKEFDLAKVRAVVPPTAKIIVYCSVGYRSKPIADQLLAAGYAKTFNLYGGLFEWVNQGHLVYTTDNTPTDAVHTYNKQWAQWVNTQNKIW